MELLFNYRDQPPMTLWLHVEIESEIWSIKQSVREVPHLQEPI